MCSSASFLVSCHPLTLQIVLIVVVSACAALLGTGVAPCHLARHLEALGVDFSAVPTASLRLVSEPLFQLVDLAGATLILLPVILDQLVQPLIALGWL